MSTYPEELLIRRYSLQSDLWGLRRELAELERQAAQLHEAQHSLRGNTDRHGRLSKPALRQEERLLTELAYIKDRSVAIESRRDEALQQLVRVETALRLAYKSLGRSTFARDTQLESRVQAEPEVKDEPRFAYDVFVSHASEDKATVARPLVASLSALGLHVWFDETALRLGDGLRSSIDHGLTHSRFGVVILSQHFLAKGAWTAYEFDSLVTREIEAGKVILPLWHKVSKDEVLSYSPRLADRFALNTATKTIEDIALEIAILVNDGPIRRS